MGRNFLGERMGGRGLWECKNTCVLGPWVYSQLSSCGVGVGGGTRLEEKEWPDDKGPFSTAPPNFPGRDPLSWLISLVLVWKASGPLSILPGFPCCTGSWISGDRCCLTPSLTEGWAKAPRGGEWRGNRPILWPLPRLTWSWLVEMVAGSSP